MFKNELARLDGVFTTALRYVQESEDLTGESLDSVRKSLADAFRYDALTVLFKAARSGISESEFVELAAPYFGRSTYDVVSKILAEAR